MVSRHSGHFVQVFKPVGPKDFYMPKPRDNRHPRQHPNYVEVEGRVTSRTVSEHSHYASYGRDGWYQMSRELSRKDAVKYAKAYKRNGFNSRVVFRGNDGKMKITDEFVV